MRVTRPTFNPKLSVTEYNTRGDGKARLSGPQYSFTWHASCALFLPRWLTLVDLVYWVCLSCAKLLFAIKCIRVTIISGQKSTTLPLIQQQVTKLPGPCNAANTQQCARLLKETSYCFGRAHDRACYHRRHCAKSTGLLFQWNMHHQPWSINPRKEQEM